MGKYPDRKNVLDQNCGAFCSLILRWQMVFKEAVCKSMHFINSIKKKAVAAHEIKHLRLTLAPLSSLLHLNGSWFGKMIRIIVTF